MTYWPRNELSMVLNTLGSGLRTTARGEDSTSAVGHNPKELESSKSFRDNAYEMS